MERAKDIVREVGIPFFLDALNMSDEETVTNSRLLDSLSQIELTEKWQQRMKDSKVRLGVTERHQKRDDEVRSGDRRL